ncbi:hypothetical protein [Tenacibaculum finnmarkense]|uniref:hypothetical protein n=1 Tax=Tenacibaculum finnmarkense TaxID=2781243 RepID=UPI001EFAF660|nr:hypothetical protein [Tenacibaculum finnmarkense]MCG8748969.1 hypothetical protein [Tenacibaculum finnmarkense]
MQKSTIKAISKSKTINYENEKINNFWVKINDKKTDHNPDYLEQIISILNDVQNSVICIQTEQINHPEVIKAIFNSSKHNNRIYLLTNNKDTGLKQLEGVCLIRYGIKNIGSFILINPNTKSEKGILFTAPFLETSLANNDNFVVKLDSEQTHTLFRFFSDNFWNNTQFEIIESFENPKEVTEAPFDFLPNINDFCDKEYVTNKISEIHSGTIIAIPKIDNNKQINSNIENSTILSSFKNNDLDLLKKLALNNTVFATHQNNANVIISYNDESWLIPKTYISENDNFFALKLNNNQINLLEESILNKIETANFKFELSKTRKELENKTIYLTTNLDENIQIKSVSNININEINLDTFLSKEDFEKTPPKFTDDGVSVTINYNWNIIPFTKPTNAKKATLYSQWESYQKEYSSFLDKISETINESETKSIGDKLKRFFLGKKQTLSKYKNDLEKLRTKDLPKLTTKERKDIIDLVNTLTTDVNSNLSEINVEIKKSSLEDEILILRKEKEDEEKILAIFIEEQNQKTKEKEAVKQEKLQLFLDSNKINKEDLTAFKSELLQQSGKKNKKKNPEEAKVAQSKLEELKNINGVDFSSKFDTDYNKHQKKISFIERNIIKKEKELINVDSDPKVNEGSSLNLAVGNKNTHTNKNREISFSIPNTIEPLPKIGVLYEAGKQKYLEIEFWEDYDLGLTEIKRLNAKLSALLN